ncbi:hypothetical protein [Variovorax sp. RB2P76]|uniref:hypothetical protein n=1 Tax=Variovorax sp. RB2P76 TaxID=3443736 RepID=UPI003F491F25
MSETAWHAALGMWVGAHANNLDCAGYPAVIDARELDARPGTRLDVALDAACCFRSSHAALASLTLLLPAPEPKIHWQLAGDADAARMLVATLAAEWGAHGLRINALELPQGLSPWACLPLLDYLAGPRSQFLTGQVVRLSIATGSSRPSLCGNAFGAPVRRAFASRGHRWPRGPSRSRRWARADLERGGPLRAVEAIRSSRHSGQSDTCCRASPSMNRFIGTLLRRGSTNLLGRVPMTQRFRPPRLVRARGALPMWPGPLPTAH